MNYADFKIEYTRIHEPRHLHPERLYQRKKTIIFFERPRLHSDEPYYPLNTEANQILFQKYQKLAQRERKIIIGGRLGDYAYYDMDKTILAALKCYKTQF